ncbi:hypothetical protein B484DRAFT_407247 [Ochromonadaceae sp. CCMP2298]|nr:hypothetical protein B484DRAFT_407247 [Ochromonadaceae sp. CCMP2298]
MHGLGTKRWANGDSYTGQWEDAEMHGQGLYTYINGDSYDGRWEEDKNFSLLGET